MKIIITSVLIVASAFRLISGETIRADYTEGESSSDLITPEIYSVAEQMLGHDSATQLMHAIKLNMAKYDIDMRSGAGRAAWHGKMIREEFYTNELAKVTVYSNALNGAVWRYRESFKPVDPMVSVKMYNSSLPKPAMTNGIPVALARARERRVREKMIVSNVTEVVTVGRQ